MPCCRNILGSCARKCRICFFFAASHFFVRLRGECKIRICFCCKYGFVLVCTSLDLICSSFRGKCAWFCFSELGKENELFFADPYFFVRLCGECKVRLRTLKSLLCWRRQLKRLPPLREAWRSGKSHARLWARPPPQTSSHCDLAS